MTHDPSVNWYDPRRLVWPVADNPWPIPVMVIADRLHTNIWHLAAALDNDSLLARYGWTRKERNSELELFFLYLITVGLLLTCYWLIINCHSSSLSNISLWVHYFVTLFLYPCSTEHVTSTVFACMLLRCAEVICWSALRALECLMSHSAEETGITDTCLAMSDDWKLVSTLTTPT